MKKMMVPLDFSPVSEALLTAAAALGKALAAKVWLIHVTAPEPDFVGYEVGPASVRDSAAVGLRRQHERMQGYRDRLAKQGIDAVAMLVPGEPGRKLLEHVQQIQPDLIIVGSHGHGALHHLLAGSVCETLLKRSPCPVLVVPSRMAAGKETPRTS